VARYATTVAWSQGRLWTRHALIRSGTARLKDDDLRVEAKHLGEQLLLVVGESTAQTPLSIQFALQTTNTLHQIPLVEALQWVVGRARFQAWPSRPPSTFLVLLSFGPSRLRKKGLAVWRSRCGEAFEVS
jgi:hypothetical protein